MWIKKFGLLFRVDSPLNFQYHAIEICWQYQHLGYQDHQHFWVAVPGGNGHPTPNAVLCALYHWTMQVKGGQIVLYLDTKYDKPFFCRIHMLQYEILILIPLVAIQTIFYQQDGVPLEFMFSTLVEAKS